MPIPVTIPRLGWNMEQGTFVEWLKADGDTVRPGDTLFKLEGEKSVEDIESLDGGILHIPAHGPKPGDRVSVGTAIAQLLQPGEADGDLGIQEYDEAANPGPVTSNPIDFYTNQPAIPRSVSVITPRARRLAMQHNIDWTKIRGSGRNGRILESDITAALPRTGVTVSTDMPSTTTRKAIAARMLESIRSTAPVTLTALVDASNLVNLRRQFKAVQAADDQPIPSFTDLLVKLAAVALQKHPVLAARWTDDGLQLPASIDIGIAVDTDLGLLVPVIRDVPSLGLRPLVVRSRELIERARAGKLPTRDMEGGCFTITNLGAFGIDAFTPIINVPESAILGVGRIERRPVMDGERVVGREQLTLSLTFDHRVVDGAPAARFLQSLADMIANAGAWLST